MLTHFKNVIATLIIIFILMSCASINTRVQDQAGRKMPDPHFVLQAVGEPILVTFYYAALKGVQDVDGTFVGDPEYLNFLTLHNIEKEKYQGIALIIEIQNPNRLKYSLYEETKIITGEMGIKMQTGGVVNSSTLEYRRFVYQLPFGDDLQEAEHTVSMYRDEHEVMRIGSFRYNLIHNKGGDRS